MKEYTGSIQPARRWLAEGYFILLATILAGCAAFEKEPSFSYYSVTPMRDEVTDAVETYDRYLVTHEYRLPPFLIEVCPPPGISYTLAEYDYMANYGMGGICVYLDLTEIEVDYLPGDWDEMDEYLKNASLELNGKKVDWDKALRWLTNSGRAISLKGIEFATPEKAISLEGIKFGFGDVALFWSPKLNYGTYQALFEITSSLGETFSYSWEFTIVED